MPRHRIRAASPLPPRDGLDAARVRMPVRPPAVPAGGTGMTSGRTQHGPAEPSWVTVVDFLADRTGDPAGVLHRIDQGEVRLGDGSVVTCTTAYRAGQWVHLYRDLPVEAPVPGVVDVLHRDDRIVVVDKPHFLATMPRGVHVAQTVLVRLRQSLDLPDLAPAHRLDRLTAGVLMLTVDPAVRAAYQSVFALGAASKTYLAVARMHRDLALPLDVVNRLDKPRGSLQTRVVDGPPNARTRVELVDRRDDLGLYRLTPSTGRTHQLRVHLSDLGIPIMGDPLYPQVRDAPTGDFADPLQLLAAELAFDDPLTGVRHRFVTRRRLSAWPRAD